MRRHYGKSAIAWAGVSLLWVAYTVVMASTGHPWFAGMFCLYGVVGGMNVGQNFTLYNEERIKVLIEERTRAFEEMRQRLLNMHSDVEDLKFDEEITKVS